MAQAINESRAVRNYLIAYPRAAPSEVAAALDNRGIKVTSDYVATIKALISQDDAASKNTVVVEAAAPLEKPADTLTRDQIKNVAQAIKGMRITVKSKHNQRQAAKKAAKTAVASEARMGDVNKTQAIRDYLKANKKATAQEVVEALAERGITIAASYVGTIKAKSRKRRRAVKQVVENVVAEGGVGVPEIKAAFAFLKAAGSVAVAKEALAAAVEIKKVV